MTAIGVLWPGYTIFVCVTAMIFTTFLFLLFLIHLDKQIAFLNWPATELLNNLGWTAMHFISACILTSRAANRRSFNQGCASVAAVLGFVLTVLYGVSTFFSFRQFQAEGGLNRLTGRGGRQGATAATITTTTTAQQEAPPAEKGGMPPDYSNPNQ